MNETKNRKEGAVFIMVLWDSPGFPRMMLYHLWILPSKENELVPAPPTLRREAELDLTPASKSHSGGE